MIFKAAIFAAALVAVTAQHYSQGHGGPSQSIISHGIGHGNIHGPVSVHSPIVPVVQQTPAVIQHVAPVHYNQVGHNQGHVEHYAPANYEFGYSVQDTHTGDIKSQHETRNGDQVSGSYSLHQPDGSVRTVHYSADAHNGFNAQVENSAPATHAQPVHYAPTVVGGHH